MPDEVIPITLHNAAEKFDMSYTELYNLGKNGQIALSRIGSILMTEENSIKCYLELKLSLEKQKRYLDQILLEKREEIDNTIALYDDFLFSMRTLVKHTRLFEILIREMAKVIKDDVYRRIFIDVSLGQSIYNVARKESFSYDKICSIYSYTLNTIERRCSIIPEYRKTIANLKSELRQKDIIINTLKEEITQLDKYNDIADRINPKKEIPKRVIYTLSLSIKNDLGLDVRTINLLYGLHINTIEDLFRYLCKRGCIFESLLEIPKLGKVSYNKLKQVLIVRNIIDRYGNSDLYEYLV